MFTGLIETIGVVRSAGRKAGGVEVAVSAGIAAKGAAIGDSIAVNGVCLTVSRIEGEVLYFNASPETVEKTTISKLLPAAKVNLERAMAAGGRFGGHFVQGHVDGLGKLKSVTRKGEFYDVVFETSQELMAEMVVKGSVAVEGISLTVASIEANTFRVAVIPVTWTSTNLSLLKIGDAVNIETDILVKAIRKQLLNILGKDGKNASAGVTIEKLMQMGY